METQKIVNLFNSFENEYSKFATNNVILLAVKQRVTILANMRSNYSLESTLCNYSDAYVLDTGNIAALGANNNAKVTLQNCHSENVEQK